MATPVARATCRALTWFRLQATRSTATADGRWAATASRMPSATSRRRDASSRPGGRADDPGPEELGPALAPGDHGEPAAREPGIDPEDHRIEHLFAAV